MEITEKERLMLVKSKESICGATIEILELESDPKNALLIKKKISIILSLLSTIASYSNSKNYNLDKLTEFAEALFKMLNPRIEILEDLLFLMKWRAFTIPDLELFCNYVNSIRFDFTKKDLKITLPKNINLGNIIHQ
jgi:hypothetical protein